MAKYLMAAITVVRVKRCTHATTWGTNTFELFNDRPSVCTLARGRVHFSGKAVTSHYLCCGLPENCGGFSKSYIVPSSCCCCCCRCCFLKATYAATADASKTIKASVEMPKMTALEFVEPTYVSCRTSSCPKSIISASYNTIQESPFSDVRDQFKTTGLVRQVTRSCLPELHILP
jgi:hypothetical protein